MQPTFRAFFFRFQFSFVQNGLLLSKGCEERKKFSNFLIFGGSKHRSFFAYAWGEVFMNIETSFVQNGLELSKGYEWKKFFRNFLFSGVRKGWILRLLVEEAQKVPRERRLWIPSARMKPFSSTVFHREKEAIDHRFGCSLDRTTYTRSIKNGR